MRSTTADWFDSLHDAYFADVSSFLQRRVRDRQLAEDLAQETFLRAYQSRDTFDPRRPAWPWLSAIARNLLINALRDHARRPEVVSAVPDSVPGTAERSHEAIPELSMHSADRWTLIRRSLAELTERERRVLMLRCERELAYADIAEAEGLTLDAMKSLLKRARQRFRAEYVRRGGDLPAIIAGPLVFLRARRRALERWAPSLMNPAMATTEVVVAALLVTGAAGGAISAATTTHEGSTPVAAQQASTIESGQRHSGPTVALRAERDPLRGRKTVAAPVGMIDVATDLENESDGPAVEVIHSDQPSGRGDSPRERGRVSIQILCVDNPDEPICSVVPQGIGK